MIIDIILISILLILSAFFSSSETALTAASEAIMKRKEEALNPKAMLVNKLRKSKEKLIGTILLGNNLVNILATSLTTKMLIDMYGSYGGYYATVIMTFLVLIFAEIMPKSYAVLNANNFSLAVAPIMNVLVYLLSPITIFIQFLVNIMLHPLNNKDNSKEEPLAEELRGAIDLHQNKDEDFHETRTMLHSILDMDELTLEQIMSHRTNLFMIDINSSLEDIISKIRQSRHTRIPFYKGNVKYIIGVLHIRSLLKIKNLQEMNKQILIDLLTEPWFVQENATLKQQLQAFKDKNELFALVVNEYGELQGCVTLSDILDDIIGITNLKHDTTPEGILTQSDGSIIVEGTVTIRDINRHYNWNLDDSQATTVAGLILYQIRRLPRNGQTFIFNNFKFHIENCENNRIAQIRITQLRTEHKQPILLTQTEINT